MTLVVLAAGMGSRYGGLKQLDPVTPHGEFIIDFSVYDAITAGYDKVVFVIKKENYSLFRESIGRRIENHIDVEYAFQTKELPSPYAAPENRSKPWGTGHAMLAAKGCFKGDFAVINADDYYGNTPFAHVKKYLDDNGSTSGRRHFCMIGYQLGNTLTENGTVSRGVCSIDGNDFLTGICENKKIEKCGDAACSYNEETCTKLALDTTVSMNLYGFTEEMMDYTEQAFERFLSSGTGDILTREFYLPTAVTEALEHGLCDVKVIKTRAHWYGVTYFQDKQKVVDQMQAYIQRGKYPDGLWD